MVLFRQLQILLRMFWKCYISVTLVLFREIQVLLLTLLHKHKCCIDISQKQIDIPTYNQQYYMDTFQTGKQVLLQLQILLQLQVLLHKQ